MPDRAEKNPIHPAELIEHGLGQDFPRFQETIPAEVVVLQVQTEVFTRSGGRKRFQGFPDDLRAGAIPWDDGDVK
jgi:hypothetical protein